VFAFPLDHGNAVRSIWLPEAEALAYIVRAIGDARRARQEYLEAARTGALEIRGRRTLMSTVRELIPREEWFRCEWLELPDRLSTGFHFLGRGASWSRAASWYDREVRRDELEALWLRFDSLVARVRRQAAVAAAVARGVRLENTPGGWKAIGGIVRTAAHVTDGARYFSDKAIERDFKKELRRRLKETRPE
jgi:hypothetical protein